MANPEADLQILVCQFLDVALPTCATYWASLNERNVSAATGRYLNTMGRKAGVADLLIVHAGRLIAIELKTEASKIYRTKRTNQTSNQKAWQGVIEAAGGFYAVCRSIDDVRGSLASFGVPMKARQSRKFEVIE